MKLPENYNSLITQKCTDLSMIAQQTNNTCILKEQIHIYTHMHNINTFTYIIFFYLLAVIVEYILVKKKLKKMNT